MSIEEAPQEQAAKRSKVDKSVAIAARLGWRGVAKGSERFVMQEKDGLSQWGSISMPRSQAGVIDAWRRLAPEGLLDKLVKGFSESEGAIGSRKRVNGAARRIKRLILDNKRALQALAVYVCVCSKQEKPSEVRESGKLGRREAAKALDFFRSKRADVDKKKTSARETIETLTSHIPFTMDYAKESSEVFRSATRVRRRRDKRPLALASVRSASLHVEWIEP